MASGSTSWCARAASGQRVQRPMINGNLFNALYKAQVHAMIAEADTNSRSNRELLGEYGLSTLRLPST